MRTADTRGMLSDSEEDYIGAGEAGDAESEPSGDEGRDGEAMMLPGAAVPGDVFSGKEDGVLPRDKQRKTAYYDYATERSLSHADAKLFYQRSQLEAQKTGGSNWGTSQHSPNGSPIIVPKGLSNLHDTDGVRRSGSMKSFKSGPSFGHVLVLCLVFNIPGC